MELTYGSTTKRVKIISFLAGMGFFAKQFYVTKNGTLQIGDVLLVLSSLLTVFSYGLKIKKTDLPFLSFIFFTIVINSIYALVYSEQRYLLSVLFMVDSCILVVCLYRYMLKNTYFLTCISISFKLALVSQIIIFIIGRGAWFGGIRYMGTFNDPNQYGFYILSALFIIYIISEIKEEKLPILWIVLASIEIAFSASSGMIIALLVFYLSLITRDIYRNGKSVKSIILIFICITIILSIILFGNGILDMLGNSSIGGIRRLILRYRMGSSNEGVSNEFFYNRGLRRAIELPYYFLYGSGEGGWDRFEIISEKGEMHSTVIALAFYYGIVPYCILLYWIKRQVSYMRPSLFFVYIALLIEAFTLINHRQPMFWLIIILASHINSKRKTRRNNARI